MTVLFIFENDHRGETVMLEKIERFIKKKKLIEDGDKLIVGVSGGADSVCLLILLHKLFKEKIELVVVHINHGIRGAEADGDENFVKALCERLGTECIIRRINIPEIAAKEKISEEEAGRIYRYKIFNEVLKERNFNKIAVAHNMNDLVETFLQNLVRGAGLTGLSGIKEKNGNIIRPLIETSRDEIEGILAKLGERFVTDSTNLSNDYTRNKIRNEIIPVFKNINNRSIEHINEAAARIREAEEYIDEVSDREYEAHVEREGADIFIENKASRLPEIIFNEVIHRALAEASKAVKDIGSVHIREVKELFLKQTGKRTDLPYGIKAFREYEGVRLKNVSVSDEKTEEAGYELFLEVEEVGEIKEVRLLYDGLLLIFNDGGKKKLVQNSCIRWFDYDKIPETVLVRTRKEGDFIVISEDGKRKKLKNYFIDSKTARDERDKIPLVASGSEILWITGARTGEGARITLETRKILKVEIKNTED